MLPTLFGIIALTGVSSGVAKEKVWVVGDLWKDKNPLFVEKGSRNFESEGPVLRSIRVIRRKLAPGETCDKALAKVRKVPVGKPYAPDAKDRFAGWGDWADDIDAVEKCGSFPCKIKFDEAETMAVAAKKKEDRLAEALRQIDARVAGYASHFRRKGYDLPEDPQDPWKVFVARGHVLPEGFAKSKATYVARKLPFGDGSYRPLRQIFDVRTFETKDRFVRIYRDVYTSHYFDGWGEWVEARCSSERKELRLLHDLLIEFDLLKKTDLLSMIARPKMRQGVDHESLKYQKEQADLFK